MNSRQRRKQHRKIDARMADLFAIISKAYKEAEADFQRWIDSEESKRLIREWWESPQGQSRDQKSSQDPNA